MTQKCHELAREIRELSAKLTADGWDRLRGQRLIHAVSAAMGEARRADWLEGVGRADALVQVLGEFVREAPGADRLAPVLVSAAELARAMLDGYLPDRVDRGVLPAEPDKWTFVALGDGFDPGTGVLRSLRALGFAVEHAAGIESPAAFAASGPTVLLAGTSWLAGHADRVAGAPREAAAGGAARPVLVAVADTGDFRSQLKARQSGARLLLDAPWRYTG